MLKIKRFDCLAYLVFYLMCKVETMATPAVAGDGSSGTAAPTYFSVHIGAVLDSKSSMGAMANLCISMAYSDFYAEHPEYRTRLVLRTKYAEDELDVASSVLELMKNEEVHSILAVGPQTWTEGKLIVELGGKAHVPVISFTDRGHSLSYTPSPYFIRPTTDDLNQAKALASICQGFEWHEAVILYEDNNYGTQFLSKLNNATQEADIQLTCVVAIPTSVEDQDIMYELRKLKKMRTTVFLVHMNDVLGTRIFLHAKKAGMMSEGYAWLITDSFGNLFNSIESAAIDSMQGVLGLRPHVPKSKNLDDFRTRWKKNMLLMKPEITERELDIYGLWAYDTIWALAMAVEKIGPVNPSFLGAKNSKTESETFNLRISQIGPKLIKELPNIAFDGLAGEFRLIDGQLKPSSLDIFNVFETGDKHKTIGYWTPDQGITTKLSLTGRRSYSSSIKELKRIIWPGDSKKQPKGVAIRKLKVGVPKKNGFNEFVNVSNDPQTNKANFSGISIDVFCSVLKLLNYSADDIKFISYPIENGTYTHLLQKVGKEIDIFVGDTTILFDRAKHVDFTLPYSESGTVLVVKDKKGKDMWSFVKPFRWDLWLTIISTCIFIGIVLRILEHGENKKSDSVGPNKQQLGLLFWFPLAVLAFPERNMVANNWSRFVLVVWLFTAYIIMQSYTANLSAMFTVDQLNFRFSNDYNIGCQKGSFVKDFLIDHLHINESKIREYSTIEDYHRAMIKGSKNGGIDAIFDEIPYMKLFLHRYDSYKIVGPTFRTDGFGFAFPLNSPLVVNFSKAILSVKENKIKDIEQQNFGPRYSSYNQSDSIKQQGPSLTTSNFGGLFIITASALLFALFCSETSAGQRLTDKATYYGCRCFSFLPFSGNESKVNSIDHPDGTGDSSSEEEQESDVSDQLNFDDSSRSGMIDYDSEQRNTNISASDGQENESEQRNFIHEVQLSEQRDIDVSARQIISS